MSDELKKTGEEAESAADEKEQDAEPDDGLPKLKMSDELVAALQEAEDHITKKVKSAKQGTEEDIEIEVDEESPAEPGGEAEQTEFDPNRVDEPESEAALPAVSAAELKLKTEVLELRQKLRLAEQEIEKRIKEFKQNREQAEHLKRQFEDHKVRVKKEKADWFNYGQEPLLKEILPVIDNLERAVDAASDDASSSAIREGVELTLRQFNGTLAKFGVKVIDPKGETFDPEFHQAMMQVDRDDVEPNIIIEVQQKGYMLKDRLLRPAMVLVSRSAGGKRPARPAAGEAGRGKKQSAGSADPAGPVNKKDGDASDESD